VNTLRVIPSVVGALAIALWLGGLVALGAIAAPVVFANVSFPASADAMTIAFRRFDLLATSCAAIVLACEAGRALAGRRFAPVDVLRVATSAAAAAAAVFEATVLSPRIESLHQAGIVRGLGAAGRELAILHDRAEWCGKAEVALLALAVALHVLSNTPAATEQREAKTRP
jgi:hypothetical protein